jgi:hypothetical protein
MDRPDRPERDRPHFGRVQERGEWDQVKLRVRWWRDGTPEPNDELRTSTGRRYLILSCTEKQIIALVLQKDAAPTDGKVWCWEWGKRKK